MSCTSKPVKALLTKRLKLLFEIPRQRSFKAAQIDLQEKSDESRLIIAQALPLLGPMVPTIIPLTKITSLGRPLFVGSRQRFARLGACNL